MDNVQATLVSNEDLRRTVGSERQSDCGGLLVLSETGRYMVFLD